MNIAVIFAGGTGKRMHSGAIPKQFLELHGKPLIVYTLEKFQNHQDIDAIVVVCLKSWIGKLEKLVNTYDLNKVRAVTPGGETPQESAFQGLLKVREFAKDDDIVLVHDGVRPLVDESTITKGIACTRKNGNAITVTPAIETIFLDNTRDSGSLPVLDGKSTAVFLVRRVVPRTEDFSGKRGEIHRQRFFDEGIRAQTLHGGRGAGEHQDYNAD